jgi:hypothetical protein
MISAERPGSTLWSLLRSVLGGGGAANESYASALSVALELGTTSFLATYYMQPAPGAQALPSSRCIGPTDPQQPSLATIPQME